MPHNGSQFTSNGVGISAVAQANAVLDVIDHFASAVRSETELATYARMQLVARVDGLYASAEGILKSLLEEIAEYRRLEADPDADLAWIEPEHPPLSHLQGAEPGVDCHEHTPLSADAALHGLRGQEVR